MDIANAVIIAANLTSAAINSLQSAQTVSSLIQKAQGEGRDKFTADEWSVITGADDQARKALQDAIDKA